MLTLKEIEYTLRDAVELLHNNGHSLSDCIDFTLKLLLLKRLSDLYKEKIDLEKSMVKFTSFIMPQEAYWDNLRLSVQEIGKEITQTLFTLENENPQFRGVFINPKGSRWEEIDDEILLQLLQWFSNLDLRSQNLEEPDLLGVSCEKLIRTFTLTERGLAKNAFTPRQISNLLVSLVHPQENMQIIDPACGSGGILVECANYLSQEGVDSQKVQIYGQESVHELYTISKINLLLHNISNFEIRLGNAIEAPQMDENGQLKRFDRVITNPPFGARNWKYDFLQDSHQRFGDFVFVEHVLAILGDKGKAAVIVPYGVLFRETEAAFRQYIVRDGLLEAIIGLPPNLFNASTASTAILIFNKDGIKERNGNILFIDALGKVELGQKRQLLKDDDILNILRTYSEFKEEPEYSKIVSRDEIAKYNYVLDFAHFLAPNKLKDGPDINEKVLRLKESEAQRAEIEVHMDDCLRVLGVEI